jgi:multi-copper polyphenol oxidoreductase laccase
MKILKNGIVQSNSLSIIHGVSTKRLGNMSYDRDSNKTAEANLKNFLTLLDLDLNRTSLIILPVNNTSNVVLLDQPKKKGRLPIKCSSSLIKSINRFDSNLGFDACISNANETVLAILPADCATVMLYDKKTGYYGLIHAGKAGIEAFIVLKTLISMQNWVKSKPEDILCYIGPNICKKCYTPQNKTFNLAKGIQQQLAIARVPGQNIVTSQFCTHHDEELFFSNWRAKASKREGRQIAIIGQK